METWLHLSVIPKSVGKASGRIKFTEQGFPVSKDIQKSYAVLIDINLTIYNGQSISGKTEWIAENFIQSTGMVNFSKSVTVWIVFLWFCSL